MIPSYYLHQSCEIRPRDVVNTSEWFNWSIPYQPSHMFCLIDAEHWKILWVVRFSRFKAIKMYYLDPLATKPYKTRFNNLFSTSHMKKYKDNAQEFISLATDHPWPQLSSTPISCIPIHLTQDTKNSGPIAAFNISRVMEHYDPNGVNLLYVKIKKSKPKLANFWPISFHLLPASLTHQRLTSHYTTVWIQSLQSRVMLWIVLLLEKQVKTCVNI